MAGGIDNPNHSPETKVSNDAMADAAREAYQAPQKEIFCEPKDFSEGWKYIIGPVAASCAVQQVIDYFKKPAKK